MASIPEGFACGNFTFYNNFDSANLAKVEQVKSQDVTNPEACDTDVKSSVVSNSEDIPAYEFNLWTKHDCHGTQYQNNNRTWFYFGIKSSVPEVYVKLNIVNLNRQLKMFSQGMCPVFKIIPGHTHWERIRDKPTYTLDHKSNDFTLSFVYKTSDNVRALTYFAFTYPFSYTDLQNYLKKLDVKMGTRSTTHVDDIYYHRECGIKSLEGRRLDVITISSYHNISMKREDRLKNMFPEENEDRPFKFVNKKVVFVSARVHPGETPSSFVINGFLNFLLNRDDQIAIILRRLYVFKLIPMLNPDGVARGHYRMDTRGINLNRVYLNPSEKDHPTIYAARSLIRYYHHGYKIPDEIQSRVDGEHENLVKAASSVTNVICDTTNKLLQQVTLMTLNEKDRIDSTRIQENSDITINNERESLEKNPNDSGLYLYIDLHGHASKKGVFMYGNHFKDVEDTITCMLLPKLISINNPNFHFTSCNFTEKNMYLIDKRDGMSREGSGRVAVYKLTGLVRSYTLECNYNSGRIVNPVPPRVRDGINKTLSHMFVPPKYTPGVFEGVGAAFGPSILDLININPNSRLPNSQYRSLKGVRSYLKFTCVNNISSAFNKHKGEIGMVSVREIVNWDSNCLYTPQVKRTKGNGNRKLLKTKHYGKCVGRNNNKKKNNNETKIRDKKKNSTSVIEEKSRIVKRGAKRFKLISNSKNNNNNRVSLYRVVADEERKKKLKKTI